MIGQEHRGCLTFPIENKEELLVFDFMVRNPRKSESCPESFLLSSSQPQKVPVGRNRHQKGIKIILIWGTYTDLE